jgi:hypothetical protein
MYDLNVRRDPTRSVLAQPNGDEAGDRAIRELRLRQQALLAPPIDPTIDLPLMVAGPAVQAARWLGRAALGSAETVGARFLAPKGLGNAGGVLPNLEQPGLTRLAMPRTPGLGPTATTAELLQSGAIPGREGIILTQRNVVFNDLWQLSDKSGVEFVLTRENGQFMLRSGSPTSAPIPVGFRPIVHTHPLDDHGFNSLLPSRADINVLNDYWARNPSIQRPVSQIITGPNQTTPFRATGLDPWSKP